MNVKKELNRELEGKAILNWTLLWTPLLLLFTFFTIVNNGYYIIGIVIYPISMIISSLNNQITSFAIWIAIFQIPLYGLILYLFRKRNKTTILQLLIFIHCILVLTAFLKSIKLFPIIGFAP